MATNKYGAFNVGDKVLFNNQLCTILTKQKGGKTTKPNKQGGIGTGFKSNPCTYSLDNGYTVRGDKLKRTTHAKH